MFLSKSHTFCWLASAPTALKACSHPHAIHPCKITQKSQLELSLPWTEINNLHKVTGNVQKEAVVLSVSL